ncbi:MAG: DUF3325 domain-containing protein [Pseudomonadota bacterium]
MTWLVLIIIALPGFAALCLSMKKCQRQIFDAPISDGRSRLYRAFGTVALSAALAWCIAAESWSIGLVIFFGGATIAALSVIITLTVRPKLVRFYCWFGAVSLMRTRLQQRLG